MATEIVFYRGVGPVAAIIRWFTKSPVSHVAEKIGQDVWEAVYWRSKYPWWIGETRKRKFDLKGKDRDIYAVFSVTDGNEDQTIKWLDSIVGTPYDKVAIILDVFAKFMPSYIHIYDSLQNSLDCSREANFVAKQNVLGLTGPVTPGALLATMLKSGLVPEKDYLQTKKN